ncbi:carbohydrate ABC transporter membrane protein 2 (CUT1 family) [Murinocardiopsis flavida]|uniref:Carbohydrate ABC transporter membrane protein 2 (CUT1 family) n=1 Tax=Murinocardiopsis flavida TaxID=645275 RepID=A0A2P8DFM6_9ACTN|nr:carbohydrate ABC transporter permease [Murinocardiopsis flavida]PSK96010.1 carbohydrate ABC transporter membrane protein 2 (CUT1 family) [Murinocardiopsis flavida]
MSHSPARPRSAGPRALRRHGPAVLAAAIGILFALPLLWVFSGSLRDTDEIFAGLDRISWTTLVPADPTLDNYATLLSGDFGIAVANSVLVSAVTVAAGLVMSAMAAFGLSAIPFRGRGAVFAVVVLSFLIPFDAIAIPLSAVFRDWSLQNTYLGLILPGIGNGLAIFLIRQFFLAVPKELVEAARLDGLGWWGVFWRIYVPLSRPVLIGAGMTLFLFQWQAYVWPLLIGTEPAKQLGPIALGNLQGQLVPDYGAIFAGSVVLIAIPLIVILRLQRYFVQSVSTSGLK